MNDLIDKVAEAISSCVSGRPEWSEMKESAKYQYRDMAIKAMKEIMFQTISEKIQYRAEQ